jgi:hypothetical protein
MWRNALIATLTTELALMMLVLGRIDSLIQFKRTIIAHYGTGLLWFLALLTLNLFAGYVLLTRLFLLKETGRRLAHVEKQVRSGAIAQDLGEALRGEE